MAQVFTCAKNFLFIFLSSSRFWKASFCLMRSTVWSFQIALISFETSLFIYIFWSYWEKIQKYYSHSNVYYHRRRAISSATYVFSQIHHKRKNYPNVDKNFSFSRCPFYLKNPSIGKFLREYIGRQQRCIYHHCPFRRVKLGG